MSSDSVGFDPVSSGSVNCNPVSCDSVSPSQQGVRLRLQDWMQYLTGLSADVGAIPLLLCATAEDLPGQLPALPLLSTCVPLFAFKNLGTLYCQPCMLLPKAAMSSLLSKSISAHHILQASVHVVFANTKRKFC